MKKFWRSGMIDKKVVKEREWEDYINRLHRVILELSRKPPEPEPCCFKCHNGIPYVPVKLSDEDVDDYWLAQHRRDIADNPLTPTQSAKKWGEGIKTLFTGEYDEVRCGDNVTLEFGEGQILTAPKESLKDSMCNTYSKWLRTRKDYGSDIEKILRDHQDE